MQDPSRTWTYSFVPNTASLLSGVTSGNFAVTYTYEPGRNAINSVENKVGTTTVSEFTYTNNALGQRTARSQSGSAFTAPATEDFGYNAKGEVISSTHSLDALRNTLYAYDGIGNRNEATFGGITTAYTANALNQYTEIDPGTLATPTYDDDGNMLSDGAGKRLVWDGDSRPEGRVARDSKAARRVPMAAGSGRHQNRLIEVRDETNALIATYTYDGQSRRVKKVTTSAAPQGATEEIYLYDGWNRIATYSVQPSSLNLHTSCTWGRDLSGSLEGAGGVGGLLGIKEGANSYRVSYDANGNISELIDGAGSIAAHYEYDPFGNVVLATGSYASANLWRFSTKPVDFETGYSYYGYRFYNPLLGRWLNRDPIEEEGGVNLYAFILNESVGGIDPLGEFRWESKWICFAACWLEITEDELEAYRDGNIDKLPRERRREVEREFQKKYKKEWSGLTNSEQSEYKKTVIKPLARQVGLDRLKVHVRKKVGIKIAKQVAGAMAGSLSGGVGFIINIASGVADIWEICSCGYKCAK